MNVTATISGKILNRIMFLLSFFGLSALVYGDIDPDANPNYIPSVLPPSPTAFELGKYGQIPVGLFTGTPNIDIPLYTLKTKNLSLPISLSYNSNGIKVDQVASWVGMGWSLNAGGVITRTVRDEADEKSFRDYPIDFNISNFCPETVEYLKAAIYDGVDNEPDLFCFNFAGYTGKFVLDPDLNPVTVPFQNLKIELDTTGCSDSINSIYITTVDGIKYIFGEGCVETSKTYSQGTNCGKSFNVPIITAWYLKKIVHPFGDTVQFNYDSKVMTYYSGISQTIKELISTLGSCSGGMESNCEYVLWTRALRLSEISANKFGSIVFRSSDDRSDLQDYRLDTIIIKNMYDQELRTISFSYQFSNNTGYVNINNDLLKHRMFLNSVIISDKVSEPVETYSFEYIDINGLPARLSYAQDHWGYFNGHNNNDFVPDPGDDWEGHFEGRGGNRVPNSNYAKKGLLAKIIYPTGGYDSLIYEPNTIYGDSITVYPSMQYLSIDTVGRLYRHSNSKSISFSVPFDQNDSITCRMDTITYESCYYAYTDPYDAYGYITLYDSTESAYLINTVSDDYKISFGNPFSIQLQLLSGHIYTLTIWAYTCSTEITGKVYYYTQQPTKYYADQIVGGLRIKEVITHDPVDDKNQIKKYYYAKLNRLDSASGILFQSPIYFSQQKVLVPIEIQWFICTYSECQYVLLHSSSQASLYNSSGQHYAYSWVTVSNGDDFENGAEEYNYITSHDTYGAIRWGYNTILDGTKTNNGWDNGSIKSKTLYRKNENDSLVKVQETLYDYEEDNRNENTLKGFVIRKNYDWICENAAFVLCTDELRNKILWWHWYRSPDTSYIIIHYHPCHDCNCDTIDHLDAIDNFDVNEYQIYSKWNYVYKETIKNYDMEGVNPVTLTKYYYYDNPEHALISRKTIFNSQGDTIKEYYYYPQDYDDGIEQIDDLKLKDLIGLPIDERKYLNNKLTDGKLTKYSENGQPIEIYKAESELGDALSFNSDDPYSYGIKKIGIAYDNNNNLISYRRDNDITVSYKWGYYSTLPVAEIKNATANEAFYTSFEPGSDYTNFEFQSNPVKDDTLSITGDYYYHTYGNTFDIINIPPGFYKLMFWSDNGGSITGSSNMTIESSKSSKPNKNNWILYEKKLSFSGSSNGYVHIGSWQKLDEIRLLPSDATMTTYTYYPAYGITSVTDESGKTTYYCYDDFGRLQLVKDLNKNILKAYSYHYKSN